MMTTTSCACTVIY